MFLRICLFKQEGAPAQVSWQDKSDNQYFRYYSPNALVELRKRSSYPVTYVRVEGDKLFFGYGKRHTGTDETFYNDEYLRGSIDAAVPRLKIQRDEYCTLPIFTSVSENYCLVSDDMEELLKTVPTKLKVNELALSQLLIAPYITKYTLFNGVELLTERQLLDWLPSRPKINIAKTLPAIKEGTTDPKIFKQVLENVLESYWYKVSGNQVGFEMSGGIDSATMPAYISHLTGQQLLLGSMGFDNSFKETQNQKFSDFSQLFPSKHLIAPINPKTDYPLSRFFEPELNLQAFYQYQEIYTEVLSRLADLLQINNVEVVFTGIGGDELFEHHVAVPAIDKPIIPAYFTKNARNLFKNLKHFSPINRRSSLLADSAYFAGQSRNKIYIDRGIWPVAPLADPRLYEYCQGLPLSYKSNKNILRAYHEARGFPKTIYHPVHNEHFGRFFEDSIRINYDGVLTTLEKQSVLKKRGLLDFSILKNEFDKAKWRESAHEQLFNIFRLASAELIMQSQADRL